ncbi:pyrroline-5-carboxylate reductase 1, mitochondrial-like [Branchiostoma floridae]|uniref:pyrroline-5-carboxylate reductase n=1 Tax=Branchiostoma floridae TaxID=7739 RepID=C3YE07_BRAFL|nr:pyrroline-5-carboxylate reductase 1, mitochondrial-like [Branchiostoma floridae]|eukprot:XP_002605472.1 hypothetical protein BRAFLDRAFT_212546 [Branchiostoma floridae]
MSVGFIGAGRLAMAMAKGFIRAGAVPAENIFASAPDNLVGRAELRNIKELGIQVTHSNTALVSQSDVVFLAIKANVVKNVLEEIAPFVTNRHLFVTPMAGVTIKSVEQSLPPETRVIRMMPNTPLVVGEGATVYARGEHATKHDGETVEVLLSNVGWCFEGKEDYMDAVTGLSGSGPAYVFLSIDALATGGVKMGLSRQESLRIAAETIQNAAKRVLETGAHPSMLKDEVCSNNILGQSALSAIHKMEKGGFRALLMDAVEAGEDRTKELRRMGEVKNHVED